MQRSAQARSAIRDRRCRMAALAPDYARTDVRAPSGLQLRLAPSPDPLQSAGVVLPAPPVDVRAVGDHLARLVIERPDRARRRADDERVVRKGLALGYDGARTDDRMGADPRPVEQDRAHADHAVVADVAAMQHDIVPDDAAARDGHRKPGIGMERGIVLDLRALADLDPFI